MLRLVILFSVLMAARGAAACVAAPSDSYRPINDLIRDAQRIVLATAIEKRNDERQYYSTVTFEVRERLKGRSRKDTFELPGIVVSDNQIGRGDFDRHYDPRFWAGSHGNGALRPDCKIFGIFEIGETYLIFRGGKPHFKAFEKIESNDDFWLKVVRTALKR